MVPLWIAYRSLWLPYGLPYVSYGFPMDPLQFSSHLPFSQISGDLSWDLGGLGGFGFQGGWLANLNPPPQEDPGFQPPLEIKAQIPGVERETSDSVMTFLSAVTVKTP